VPQAYRKLLTVTSFAKSHAFCATGAV